MNYNTVFKPWPYAVFKKFFTKEEIEMLKPLQESAQIRSGMHWITMQDGWRLNDMLQDKAWNVLYPAFVDLKKITKDIKAIRSDKKEDVFFRIGMMSLKPGTEHKIHLDDDWKQQTTVVYLSKEGLGTDLYTGSEQEDYYHSVDWKFNKGYTFVPSEHSWHSFKHPKHYKRNRVTVMFNMCNKRCYI